jgi:hypothetical protein
MQTSPYKAYRLAKARMEDAHWDAERWRLARSVPSESHSSGWLERLGLRRASATAARPGGQAGQARRVAGQAATSAPQ